MQEQSQPFVHIGTSSWLFDGWRGVFYPDKLPKNQYLPFYATQFDTVERIDLTQTDRTFFAKVGYAWVL